MTLITIATSMTTSMWKVKIYYFAIIPKINNPALVWSFSKLWSYELHNFELLCFTLLWICLLMTTYYVKNKLTRPAWVPSTVLFSFNSNSNHVYIHNVYIDIQKSWYNSKYSVIQFSSCQQNSEFNNLLWQREHMMTSPNGNIFRVTGP